MSFKNIFDSFISEKVDDQLEIIDKLCLEFDIDPEIWFNFEFKRNLGDHSGSDFLREMLPNFIYYLSKQFENQIMKFVGPSDYNIHREPYLSIDWELEYKNGKFKNSTFRNDFQESFDELNLKLSQKIELMKNKLFNAIVTQTKLKIYSKSDIRALKLRQLNEYSTDITG